jgi:opacity protein-like surface antigen
MSNALICFCISAACLIGSLQASAQTSNPFSGFSFGAQGSYISSSRSGTNSFVLENFPYKLSTSSYSQSGGAMGMHIGYDYVSPMGLLFGAKLSYSVSDVHGEYIDSVRDGIDQFTSDAQHRLESIAMAQGRIGYATSSWAAYATGGYVISSARNDAGFTRLVPSSTGGAVRLYGTWSDVEPQSGWTVGAGGSVMIDDHVSLGICYNFVEYDKDQNGLSGSVGTFSTGSVPIYMNSDIDTEMHMVSLNLSYRF